MGEGQLAPEDAISVAELAAEVSRLTNELTHRDAYIMDLEASHAEQMRVRTETEARAVADALMLRKTLNEFYSSSSWRVTRPLRDFTMMVRALRNRFRNEGRDGGRTTTGPIADSIATDALEAMDPDPKALSAWMTLLSKHAFRAG